jgi:hypothetical protein
MKVTMRTKKKPIIPVLLILAALVLVAGCVPIKGILTGKKCDIDTDCGEDYCNDDQQKIVSPTCVNGRCENKFTECSESEICIQDSLGVKCVRKDSDSSKGRLSCSENTDTFSILGKNPYNPSIYVCKDDCPEDSFCSDSCFCEEKEEISCSRNTDDFNSSGTNQFDQRTKRCADDCPGGFDCNAQCICEERPRGPCPEPVFTTNYFGGAPPVDFDFETLYDMWLDDPGSLLDLGDTITITAYEHYRDGGFYYIPFPEMQLTLIPNPDNEYIEQYGAWCVNDYYEGEKALDINLKWLTRPEETCIWGGREPDEGVLTVCPEHIIDWFNEIWEKSSFL